MKVRELIEELGKFDPEWPVRIEDDDTSEALDIETVDKWPRWPVLRIAGSRLSRVPEMNGPAPEPE